MFPITEKGIFKIVGAHDLEMWTGMGWRLVAVLENEMPMPFSDVENFQNAIMPGQNSFNPLGGFTSATSTKYHPTRTPQFLLCQSEDSAIAGLNAKIFEQAEKLKDALKVEKDFAEMSKANVAYLERCNIAETEVKRLTEQITRDNKMFAAKMIEIADKAAFAEKILASRKRTAYERISEGEYDDRAETLEERDVGDTRNPDG
jgi:hypothetical protein